VRRLRDGREHILTFNGEPLETAARWMACQRALWTSRLDALEAALREQERAAPPQSHFEAERTTPMSVDESDASALRPVEPVRTAHLFPGLHAELMALLRGLTPEDWGRVTWAGPWTVKDVVAHLLDGQIRKLSICRDGHAIAPPGAAPADYGALLRFLDGLNAEWVAAARRIGPRVLVDLLDVIGPQDTAYVASLDPDAPALFNVAWAGDAVSPNWFDVGREYTERWHHQQQIRDAVGAPGLVSRHWLHPVLDVSVRALPHAYRDVAARAGQAVTVVITGEAGDTWSLVRHAEPAPAWNLCAGAAEAPVARVTMSADTAWRLFFTAAKSAELLATIQIEGDPTMAAAATRALAVMA
jgi:uncharacterized protein (TIGR03083 family)